jgi:hypothetical protein
MNDDGTYTTAADMKKAEQDACNRIYVAVRVEAFLNRKGEVRPDKYSIEAVTREMARESGNKIYAKKRLRDSHTATIKTFLDLFKNGKTKRLTRWKARQVRQAAIAKVGQATEAKE